MSNPECKCLKPEGGGTKCPPQHIALCIRGKDKECYGECIPIPNTFRFETVKFKEWMTDSIQQQISDYISTVLAQENRHDSFWLEKDVESTFQNGGTITFMSPIGSIDVRFNFQFKDEGFEPGSFQNFRELTM